MAIAVLCETRIMRGMDYAKWLAGEFARTGKAKRGLAKAWGRGPAAVTRTLTGKRQLKAKEEKIAKAYFGNESLRDKSENRPDNDKPRETPLNDAMD